MFLLLPALTAVVIVAVAPRLREPHQRVTVGSQPLIRGVREIVTRPFLGVWATRLVFAVAMSAALVFALYMFLERWDLPEDQAVRLVTAATLAGAIGLVVASGLLAVVRNVGWADATMIRAALLVLVGALAGGAVAPRPMLFVLCIGVGGCAVGVGYTCTRALAHALLPHNQSALGLGVLNVASTLAAAIAPVLAGGLLALGSHLDLTDAYAGMLVLLAAVIAVGSVVTFALPAARPSAT